MGVLTYLGIVISQARLWDCEGFFYLGVFMFLVLF